MPRFLAVTILVIALLLPTTALAQTTGRSADLLDGRAVPPLPAPSTDVTLGVPAADMIRGAATDGFELLGHEPLGNRGMNAAIAVHDGYVYVGSRTDGQPQHLNPGIQVVDATDPTAPTVVGEITEGLAADVSHTSRELRVWPQRDLLVVLNFGCSSILHACAGSEARSSSSFDLFDISGDRAAAPVLIDTYAPPATPHEFFLWVDPEAPSDRALLFWTAPTSSRTRPSMYVTDISGAGTGEFDSTSWVADFPGRALASGEAEDRRLHSIGVSADGRTTHLAFLGAGYLALDTSQVIDRAPAPEITLLTPAGNRAAWTNPGAHTSVPVPGTDRVLVTDEVYGDLVTPIAGGTHGCPWGWLRTLDVSDLSAPTVTAEYRLPENQPGFCEELVEGSPAGTAATSYSAHNPTVTGDLAFITWHSAGLQVVDISDPDQPTFAAQFKPEPLDAVVTEDPALGLGLDKVIMWSYPVISDGLVYVVDVRNGLYILRYTGPHAEEVAGIDFLESNSNVGDALLLDPVALPTDSAGLERPAAVVLVATLLMGLSAWRRRRPTSA